MADLLGSILNSMDKPPTTSGKEDRLLKKLKQEQVKQQAVEKDKLLQFRKKVEDSINKFFQDPKSQKHKFPSMNKVYRSIVHDVADIAGVTAFSFGEEEVDRHVMIFKKEYAPTDDELQVYRMGEEWNAEKAETIAKLKELKKLEDETPNDTSMVVNPMQKEKHEKRFGKEAAKGAERIVTPDRQFGFVSSTNKKDQRSIEQTLADIRARKKQKVTQCQESQDHDED